MPSKREYQQIRVDQLVPFKDHPFELYEGHRFEDMVKSVQANACLYRSLFVPPKIANKL